MSVYSTYLLTLTPSLYWTLDAGTGATDQSGNGRNGTGQGGISIGGYSGSPILGESTATSFDGSNDRITSSYDPGINGTTRSYIGWASRTDHSSNDALFGLGNSTTDLLLNTTQAVQPYVGGVLSDYWPAAWLGDGQWIFWAYVFNEATDAAILYLNGSVVAPTLTLTGTYGGGGFQVGAYSTAGAEFFGGQMAHVAVFESGLTATQILNIYNTGITGVAPVGVSDPVKPSFIHSAGRGQ